ncbi:MULTISPECIES: YfcL family protein [Tatumella]|uniref:YfcL family protein n=3 Tax=Tatumella TaxID=82986 RepID=A0A085JGZ8_9GAMM|nr:MULTISPECIES: YfcL family protein [Tatumella]KFD19744.1 hypothetical protein GTPT_1676 [Tatumella ptyseos ATCC 33301]MBS0909863.1 YfcL family protein [Tatumella sp. JGM118]SQK75690.1 YfcL protein [Tatumella ptyseos]
MIIEIETKILTMIDDMVEDATDDQLFAGGYIRGHLTQSVAELELQGKTSAAALKQQVEESLQQAIRQQELSPPDQVLVLDLWQELYLKASSAA